MVLLQRAQQGFRFSLAALFSNFLAGDVPQLPNWIVLEPQPEVANLFSIRSSFG